MTKSKMNVQAAAAHHKVYVESKVAYIDPDFTAAKKLKAEVIESNAKYAAWKADMEEAEKTEAWTWGESE